MLITLMKRYAIIAMSVALMVAVGCTGTSPYADLALGAGAIPDSVYFVVDTSGSMLDPDRPRSGAPGRVKLDSAKRALSSIIDEISGSSSLGLRQYPGSTWGPCDVEPALLDLGRHSRSTLDRAVDGLFASGQTPTGEALEAAAQDIRAWGSEVTVVLISDGLSNCAPPCPIAERLAATTPWTVITIGFDLGNADPAELVCIADVTGGRYISIEDGAQLEELFADPGQLFTVTG
jgi:hypothetical protein